MGDFDEGVRLGIWFLVLVCLVYLCSFFVNCFSVFFWFDVCDWEILFVFDFLIEFGVFVLCVLFFVEMDNMCSCFVMLWDIILISVELMVERGWLLMIDVVLFVRLFRVGLRWCVFNGVVDGVCCNCIGEWVRVFCMGLRLILVLGDVFLGDFFRI